MRNALNKFIAEFPSASQPERPHERHRRHIKRNPKRRKIHLHIRHGLLSFDDLHAENQILAGNRRRPENSCNRAPRQRETVD